MDDVTKMGCRSQLVLQKLGHDLRDSYAETLHEPLPPGLAALAFELSGYAEWRDVEVRPSLPAFGYVGSDRPFF